MPDLAPYSAVQETAYFAKTRTARLRAYGELWRQVPDWLGRVPTSLLDVGCGDGLLLEIARRAGTEVLGLEVSASLIRLAQQRLGARSVSAAQPAQFPPASFDVVTLINVVEHLHSPRQMLQSVARIIRPGGLMLVHVPNFGGLPARLAGPRWHQIEPLAHFYYFTRRTLSQMLRECGFGVSDRFNLIVADKWRAGAQHWAGRLGIYLDNGLGLVARRRTD
jgi:2-polyprenyl-3-methyl-5-hydroxy-6-metoxy-1,4-benzoquinol methylase